MRRVTSGWVTGVALALACTTFGQLGTHAVASRPPTGGTEEFSPLFAKRLEVGIQNMDRSGDLYTPELAGMLFYSGPVETPASANPFSVCLASGCAGSVCLGSACVNSACLGSVCYTSGCLGSSCTSSLCGASGCLGSICGGSACVGSGCLGSACLGSGCLGSACMQCGVTEPTEPAEIGELRG